MDYLVKRTDFRIPKGCELREFLAMFIGISEALDNLLNRAWFEIIGTKFVYHVCLPGIFYFGLLEL